LRTLARVPAEAVDETFGFDKAGDALVFASEGDDVADLLRPEKPEEVAGNGAVPGDFAEARECACDAIVGRISLASVSLGGVETGEVARTLDTTDLEEAETGGTLVRDADLVGVEETRDDGGLSVACLLFASAGDLDGVVEVAEADCTLACPTAVNSRCPALADALVPVDELSSDSIRRDDKAGA
jgi:hypothetical protein